MTTFSRPHFSYSPQVATSGVFPKQAIVRLSPVHRNFGRVLYANQQRELELGGGGCQCGTQVAWPPRCDITCGFGRPPTASDLRNPHLISAIAPGARAHPGACLSATSAADARCETSVRHPTLTLRAHYLEWRGGLAIRNLKRRSVHGARSGGAAHARP